MVSCFMNDDIDISEDDLLHYGMPRRSGRYPWGSGEDPYQHGRDFLGRVEELKKSGWKETPDNIMKEFGLTTTQYRMEKAIAKDERRMLQVDTAKRLRDKEGLNPTEIGRKMGINESSVRSLLNEKSESNMKQARNTADLIKKEIESKGMIDVGVGVERELNISREKLNQALYLLEREGYPIYKGGIAQPTNPGQQTTQIVICPTGTPHPEIYNYEHVPSLHEYITRDGGETFDKFVYPKSMDSSRLMIRYADDVGPDGAKGIEKDGVIELRRGVADLSLGNDHYSQVRILVDDNKYLKGMAVYSDDMPDGVDVIFNTNKKSSVAKMDVLKNIKDDPDNPFGSLIKPGGQSYYIDKDGKKQLSLINKRAAEGDWSEWKDALPSQFLGKQSLSMAKKQLGLAKADKLAEFDEIKSITNPTIKKHFLQKFADNCDAAAVNLQAAALPGQKYHVIMPINSLKDTEVYAPNYKDGTKLALVRYPHGGTFEIPILTVNNKNKIAKKLLGSTTTDAVGITSKVAERLSGADFDGDTVMCIPTHDAKGKVKVTSFDPPKGNPLKELENFDPKTEYPERKGMQYMRNTGTQMGVISNLITDMTLAGASDAELARAVKHSMVVIDAEKHKLDYKQSEIDNNISELKKTYQAKVDKNGNVTYGGATTILSKAKSREEVPKRQGSPKVNMKDKPWYDPNRPEGALIYTTAKDLTYQKTKVNKRTGEVTTVTKTRTQNSTKMAETDDAYTLVSKGRHPMELVYADYANSMKSLANQARKEMMTTGNLKQNRSAKEAYSNEVKSLEAKLNTALKNAPMEREALRRANAAISAKKASNPDMSKSDIKKASQQAVTKFRSEVGSSSRRERNIKITDKEWEAIQAGAISENKLQKILNNTDVDDLRQRATPRSSTTLSQAKVNQIKAMSSSNYTLSQIADKLGVSSTTVSKYLKGEN